MSKAQNLEIRHESSFSLELKSRYQVKLALLAGREDDEILIEGTLGRIENVRFIDGVLLEFRGSKGTFRVSLSRLDMLRFLREAKKQE